jgi:hypothetical protein
MRLIRRKKYIDFSPEGHRWVNFSIISVLFAYGTTESGRKIVKKDAKSSSNELPDEG